MLGVFILSASNGNKIRDKAPMDTQIFAKNKIIFTTQFFKKQANLKILGTGFSKITIQVIEVCSYDFKNYSYHCRHVIHLKYDFIPIPFITSFQK